MQQQTQVELPQKNKESLAVKGYYLFPSVLLSAQYEMLVDKLEALWLEEGEAAGQAGDVLVFNGQCWHAGAGNQTDSPRRAILAHYLRDDQPLGPDRRQRLSPEAAAGLSEDERRLLALQS